MIEQQEYTIRVRQVGLTARILRQLPTIWGIPMSEVEEYEFVCWIRGEEALGKEFSRDPYIIVQHQSGDVFLYRSQSHQFDGNTLLTHNRRVPFAVVR